MSEPAEFDSYAFILLRRPNDAPDLPESDLVRLQEEHLAYLGSLDRMVLHGPFRDQDDDSFRGLCVFAQPLHEARELVSKDPLVRAGRLYAETMTWLTAKGTLRLGESASS